MGTWLEIMSANNLWGFLTIARKNNVNSLKIDHFMVISNLFLRTTRNKSFTCPYFRLQIKMKKGNKQGLFDTPRTVMVNKENYLRIHRS